MKKILCFGNPFIEEDSLALTLADNLDVEGFEFVKCVNPDELLEHSDVFAVMDVTFGIDEVRLIDDLRLLAPVSPSSLHDFDLSFYLKLMYELGKLEKLRIIALPATITLSDAELQVKELLGNMSC